MTGQQLFEAAYGTEGALTWGNLNGNARVLFELAAKAQAEGFAGAQLDDPTFTVTGVDAPLRSTPRPAYEVLEELAASIGRIARKKL